MQYRNSTAALLVLTIALSGIASRHSVWHEPSNCGGAPFVPDYICVAIRYQVSVKTFQKTLWTFVASVRLVLKEADMLSYCILCWHRVIFWILRWQACYPISAPAPLFHPRGSRIAPDIVASCLYMLVQRLQPALGTPDYPVGHGGSAQIHILSRPGLSCRARGTSSTYFFIITSVTVDGDARKCVIREGSVPVVII